MVYYFHGIFELPQTNLRPVEKPHPFRFLTFGNDRFNKFQDDSSQNRRDL
jgi:hypothetical protein